MTAISNGFSIFRFFLTFTGYHYNWNFYIITDNLCDVHQLYSVNYFFFLINSYFSSDIGEWAAHTPLRPTFIQGERTRPPITPISTTSSRLDIAASQSPSEMMDMSI